MLSLSRYRLLSGSNNFDAFTNDDFETVQTVIVERLLSALCLQEEPQDDILWDQLVADALTVSVQVQTNDGVESESIRNYSYTMSDLAGSWELLHVKSGDLLAKFNECDSGVRFQTDIASHIYGGYRGCV